jgi:aryl-alcohol dehydrogenase-like predicted oxidoreductase
VSHGGVALGCGNFGGIGSAPEFFGQGVDDETAFAIMDTAWARGIRWFDTADAYGGGKSEELIGRWRHAREPADLVVTTKVFHSTHGKAGDAGLAPDRIRRQLEGSLARLGVQQVDLYLAHEPDSSVPLVDTIATFEALREEGLIAAWGLSNYDADGIREALAVAQPALVQNSFSLLERRDERDVIPLCAERGIAYVPFGPLAGGWLTGKYRRDEAFPAGSRMTQRPGPYEHLRTDAVFDGLDRLREEATERDVDTATLAFAWVLAHPGVGGAVCGPMRPEHLEPVLAARDLMLTESDHRRIGGLFA